ncbi:MAG: glycosyltransferase [Actinomycetota bacterium]|nr:glycosyltransferase [Actinomycetota bacterium]
MIRLGLVAASRGLGGAESYLRTLVRAVDRDTFDITLITPAWRPLESFLGLPGDDGVRHVRVPLAEPGARARGGDGASAEIGLETPTTFGARVARTAGPLRPAVPTAHSLLRLRTLVANRRRLVPVLGDAGLDVLHVNTGGYPGSSAGLAAVLAAADAGVAGRAMTVHSTARPRTWLAPAEERLDRRVSEVVDKVVVLGTAPAEALARRSFPPTMVEVIPTGIPVPSAVVAATEARRRLGLDGVHRVVGMISSFTPVKQHGVLLEAFAMLRRRVPDAVLVLAGQGPTLEAARRRAEALGLGGTVRFPGRVDPFDVLPALDVFVLASGTEGLPLSILEAMSQGVPVVASAVGAVPDIVVPGRTGQLVPPGDGPALAAAVEQLLMQPAAARALGARGRRAFVARHTAGAMVDRYQDLWLGLASQRPDQ